MPYWVFQPTSPTKINPNNVKLELHGDRRLECYDRNKFCGIEKVLVNYNYAIKFRPFNASADRTVAASGMDLNLIFGT